VSDYQRACALDDVPDDGATRVILDGVPELEERLMALVEAELEVGSR